MKKLLLLLLMITSAYSFASTAPLKIVNNTQFYVSYQLITYPPIGSGLTPEVATSGNSQGLITVAPFSTTNYDVPGAPGLPYNLIPSWNVNTNTNQISGNTAYANYGSRFRWGKFKFFVSIEGNPSTSIVGGNVGPMGDFMSITQSGVTIAWTPAGTGVIVTISPA
ncbi:hypothetical protein ACX0HA_07110 [Flavobacterium hauense]